MEYLLRVQKAIAATEKAFAPQDEYAEGWVECGGDLTYGISLGSGHAVMQQIKYWIDPVIDAGNNLIPDDAGDKAYWDRMQEIHKFIEE
jgi:hypothetical protein